MSALVQVLVLAPVPDLAAAALARHSLTAGRRWSEDHCPERINPRHPGEGAAAEPYWPAVGQDRDTADRQHRGRGRKGELPAMIKIDVFEENHRFSN
jgi:hypothetical protein